MNKRTPIVFAAALAGALALGAFPVSRQAQDQGQGFRGFVPNSIVVSGTVYAGNADTVTPGEVLPPGCQNTGPVTVAKFATS